MNELVRRAVLAGALLGVAGTAAQAQTRRTERARHPRISAAIRQLRDVVAYLNAAPDTFGGHKQAAINACNAAITELQAALDYRAVQDRR